MDDETFNGWRNRETWLVHLWLTNTESVYRDVLNLVRQQHEGAMPTEQAIRYYVRDIIQDTKIGIWSDLALAACARCDWASIAAEFINDAQDS